MFLSGSLLVLAFRPSSGALNLAHNVGGVLFDHVAEQMFVEPSNVEQTVSTSLLCSSLQRSWCPLSKEQQEVVDCSCESVDAALGGFEKSKRLQAAIQDGVAWLGTHALITEKLWEQKVTKAPVRKDKESSTETVILPPGKEEVQPTEEVRKSSFSIWASIYRITNVLSKLLSEQEPKKNEKLDLTKTLTLLSHYQKKTTSRPPTQPSLEGEEEEEENGWIPRSRHLDSSKSVRFKRAQWNIDFQNLSGDEIDGFLGSTFELPLRTLVRWVGKWRTAKQASLPSSTCVELVSSSGYLFFSKPVVVSKLFLQRLQLPTPPEAHDSGDQQRLFVEGWTWSRKSRSRFIESVSDEDSSSSWFFSSGPLMSIAENEIVRQWSGEIALEGNGFSLSSVANSDPFEWGDSESVDFLGRVIGSTLIRVDGITISYALGSSDFVNDSENHWQLKRYIKPSTHMNSKPSICLTNMTLYRPIAYLFEESTWKRVDDENQHASLEHFAVSPGLLLKGGSSSSKARIASSEGAEVDANGIPFSTDERPPLDPEKTQVILQNTVPVEAPLISFNQLCKSKGRTKHKPTRSMEVLFDGVTTASIHQGPLPLFGKSKTFSDENSRSRVMDTKIDFKRNSMDGSSKGDPLWAVLRRQLLEAALKTPNNNDEEESLSNEQNDKKKSGAFEKELFDRLDAVLNSFGKKVEHQDDENHNGDSDE